MYSSTPLGVVVDNFETVPVTEFARLVQERGGHGRLETVDQAIDGIRTKVEDVIEDADHCIRLYVKEDGLSNKESWNIGA